MHDGLAGFSIAQLPSYPLTKSSRMLAALTVLASAAAAGYAGYAAMAPTPQLYGRTLTHGSDPAQMALTFDDGPNDTYTLHLLCVMAQPRTTSTFFILCK